MTHIALATIAEVSTKIGQIVARQGRSPGAQSDAEKQLDGLLKKN